jgi:hypothetical protein
MSCRIRAHHLLATMLASTDSQAGYVPREDLIERLLKSQYASTAESKLSGYMSDIRTYGNGVLESIKEGNLITHYRLVNRQDFDPKTGINRTIDPDESPVRRGAANRAARKTLSHA